MPYCDRMSQKLYSDRYFWWRLYVLRKTTRLHLLLILDSEMNKFQLLEPKLAQNAVFIPNILNWHCKNSIIKCYMAKYLQSSIFMGNDCYITNKSNLKTAHSIFPSIMESIFEKILNCFKGITLNTTYSELWALVWRPWWCQMIGSGNLGDPMLQTKFYYKI